ncbi:DUF333 domain-containing protein [Acetobacteraceae bacterium]|nr:DUF333 domain-containing protein [Acetobacteraceae bacterium]
MKKLLATTALLTGLFGLVGVNSTFASASTTDTAPVAQDKINLEQAQAKTDADKALGDAQAQVNEDQAKVASDADSLKAEEQKDLTDAKASGENLGALEAQEAKQVGAVDSKKKKSVSLMDQELAKQATAEAQKNAQAAADKGEDASKKAQDLGGKADPAALYCSKVGGHAHNGKGITGKETEYCYLPNNTRVKAEDAYQKALKGKGSIAPAKLKKHMTKDQKHNLTAENQVLKQEADEKTSYAERQVSN